jgi:hypothetical protein
VVALEILLESIHAGSGEEMAEGFVVTIAGGEVEAVETAKLEDAGAGASLVVESAFGCGIAGGGLGFAFAENGVGGVGHRAGSFPGVFSCGVKRDAGCEERFVPLRFRIAILIAMRFFMWDRSWSAGCGYWQMLSG